MRKLVIAAALILVLALALAAPGAGAAPRGFFGTVSWHEPNKAEFDRMGRGKVGTFRATFLWPAVQPLNPADYPGYYFWNRYDRLIGRAASNGIRVLPTVYGSPSWAAKKSSHPPRPAHRPDFRKFLRAAAERYGPGGLYWSTEYAVNHPGKRPLPITAWQIWNEVNSPTYWTPRPHGKQYKPLLVAASRGVKSVNPNSRIVLAGLFSTPRIKGGVFLNRYLRQLYRAGGRRWFDVMAVHPYALTPKRVITSVRRTRSQMRRFRDGKKRIWITEVGWATSGKRTPVTVKPKRQARYLRQTFRLTRKLRKRLRIAGVIWYSWRDQKPRRWIFRTGLFTRNFTPKPSWRAFVRATGGRFR